MKLIDERKVSLAKEFVDFARHEIDAENSRTLDHFFAKIYYYSGFVYERLGLLNEFVPTFLDAYRSACHRNDEQTQATVINYILRSYISDNLYNQAANLIEICSLPENVSSNQQARYLYYEAKIEAVQLKYAQAQAHVIHAARKASEYVGKAFRVQAMKLRIIVELLMGEIPDRTIFSDPDTKSELYPYFIIVQTVRKGNLGEFLKVVTKYEDLFKKNDNYNLLIRLRHNVLKFGLRKINASYSRISLQDVMSKLGLPSVEETECIVAKAIRDKVIDAVIDREAQELSTRDVQDVYSSNAPQGQLDKRIRFCMEIYNDSVKALEFPKKDDKKIQFMLDEEDDLQDEAELVESLLEEFEDL
jgi:26S proteasome regulatory subunit N3